MAAESFKDILRTSQSLFLERIEISKKNWKEAAMKKKNPFIIISLIFLLILVHKTNASQQERVDKLQIEKFGVSALQGVKTVYPQVSLELIQRNNIDTEFVPNVGLLTQNDLSQSIKEALIASNIEVADSFDIDDPNAPLCLNTTVFIRITGSSSNPNYVVSVNNEALQPVCLLRDNEIRTLSRTWPVVQMGLSTRNIVLLNSRNIETVIKEEVAHQLHGFIRDYNAANPIKENLEQRITGPPKDIDLIAGTVIFIPMEGGFYGLITDDETRYDPINLPERFQKHGMRVRFKVAEKEELASIHMWGTIAELIEIEEL